MLSLFLALLLSSGPGFLAQDPAADQLIRHLMQSTYDLKLGEARIAAETLERQYPNHPAGFTLLADSYWWQAQMDPGNKAIEDAFYSAQKLAVEKGEAALKSPQYSKTEIDSYLASAYASYARFQVTQKSAYFSALRAGLKAHDLADQVYRLDPGYYDIYVGIGSFNYFTGSLPSVIKPFAHVMGVRGDRELGIEQLKTGMLKAHYSQTEARIVYYTAMLVDKNYPEAFHALEKLLSDYPDNYVMYTWVTDWYRQQGKNLEGAAYFAKLFSAERSRSPLMAKYALLEKARLENAENRPVEVGQTIVQLKSIPGGDALLNKKVDAFEKTLKK